MIIMIIIMINNYDHHQNHHDFIHIYHLTSTATASTQLGDPASAARLRFVRGEVAEAEKNIYIQ